MGESDVNEISARGQAEETIDAAIVRVPLDRAGPVGLRLPEIVEGGEMDALADDGRALRVGDASRDHAAGTQRDLDVFGILAVGEAEGLALRPVGRIARDDETRRDRAENVAAGREPFEPELPRLVGRRAPGPLEIERPASLRPLQRDLHAPRRPAADRHATRDARRPLTRRLLREARRDNEEQKNPSAELHETPSLNQAQNFETEGMNHGEHGEHGASMNIDPRVPPCSPWLILLVTVFSGSISLSPVCSPRQA